MRVVISILQFGKQAGVIPSHGTKETHANERELFKQCSLGVNYGMGAQSLALRIDKPEIEARQLLALHRNTYPRFWHWSTTSKTTGICMGNCGPCFAGIYMLRDMPIPGV